MFRTDLLAEKRILVTGGGTGLGKAMAGRFAELGADVVICGRRGGVLDEAKAELAGKTGGSVSAHVCDIRQPSAVEAMIENIWADGPLDALVNNAAGNFIAPTEGLSHRAFDAIAATVFHGTFYATLACGKRWIAENRRASVLSILVTWIWSGSPFVVPSAMAKAGIAAMTQSLAAEWGPKGIRLNAIAPGAFPTEGAGLRLSPLPGLAERNLDGIPLGRAGRHDELANLAAFLLADDVAYINGEIVTIDGGRWLNNAGAFGNLASLTKADWEEIRARIKAQNEIDKAKRQA
jgi:NAD(P)-dependent dehydrogenase (short-subunit alcohol dehydrogenase family)